MPAVFIFIGFMSGILAAITAIYAYLAYQDNRSAEDMFWLEQKRHKDYIRQHKNDPRDRLEQAIIDEADKGLKNRDEK